MVHGAQSLCESDSLQEELDFLGIAFKENTLGL